MCGMRPISKKITWPSARGGDASAGFILGETVGTREGRGGWLVIQHIYLSVSRQHIHLSVQMEDPSRYKICLDMDRIRRIPRVRETRARSESTPTRRAPRTRRAACSARVAPAPQPARPPPALGSA
jgi:hypothetical protein